MHRQGVQNSSLASNRSQKLDEKVKEAVVTKFVPPTQVFKSGAESDRPTQNYMNLDELEVQFERLMIKEK
jgi:hypothetical protein